MTGLVRSYVLHCRYELTVLFCASSVTLLCNVLVATITSGYGVCKSPLLAYILSENILHLFQAGLAWYGRVVTQRSRILDRLHCFQIRDIVLLPIPALSAFISLVGLGVVVTGAVTDCTRENSRAPFWYCVVLLSQRALLSLRYWTVCRKRRKLECEENEGENEESLAAIIGAECPICLEDYDPQDVLRTIPCRHTFHATCICTWLRVDNVCPMCRAVVVR